MATTMEPSTAVATVVRAEQITHNPLTFTSTFSISERALVRRGPKPDGPEIWTDRCGLGWTFGIQAHRLVSPPVANGILQPVLAAARNRRRLIVDFSVQDSIPAINSYSDATNLIVRAHFDSSTIAFAGHLGIKHMSCTLRAPGPEGATRSCDRVSVALAETVTIGTFNYEHSSVKKECGNDEEEATFIFTFVVEMGNARSDIKTIPQQVERRAATGLAESIRTGCMVDTKFYLYSRRDFHSGASHPKEIYASSAILRGFSDDLDLLLAPHGFKGSETVSLDLFELKDEDMATEAYDYPGEDNDLDGPFSRAPSPPSNFLAFMDSSPPTQCPSPFMRTPLIMSPPTIVVPLPADSPMPATEECSPHLINNAPMCQPEDVSSREPAILPTNGPKVGEDGDGDQAKPTNEDLTVALTHVQTVTDKNFMRMGRVIVIKDTAFATWEALIRYVYFNEVHFNCLGASRPAQGQCSPKSMYRLADKFGIQTLKDLALENIKTQLSVENVTIEVFSRFSSLYPEILHAEIEYLLKNSADSSVQAGISQALQAIATGEYVYKLDAMQRVMTGLTTQSLTQTRFCSQGVYCYQCCTNHYR